ncbi:MAG: nucleotide exchange factor GrpE [Christensenellales bacterium]|jgi:molecular chaperone GrpE
MMDNDTNHVNDQPIEEQETQKKKAEEKKSGSSKEPKMSAQQKVIDELCAEKDRYLNLAQRLQADFENYKKRNANARGEGFESGKKDTLCAILPVVDNLERAICACDEENALLAGIQMIYKQLMEALLGLGVQEIEAKGAAFNPDFHHAVMQEEVCGVESGTVIEVLQKGYLINQSVLRYAMVKVAE